jgi:hypothetical protein
MKHLAILTFAAILIAGYAFASDTHIVDWPSLRTAFFGFLENPDQKKAESVTVLLPSGKSPSRKVEAYDRETAKDIFWELRKIEQLVLGGNVYAYKVAIALDEIADGENGLWISQIKGAGITKFPKEYLVGVKERDMPYAQDGQSPCFDAVLVTPQTAENHVSILEARLKAINSVKDPALTSEKKCAVEILKDYVDRDPIY